MRISIRRCLSMLRNTSDGNELAMPATNASQKEHSIGCLLSTGELRMRWCAEDLGLSLRWHSSWWL